MNEFLSSIRSAHLVLITISVAVAVFALSPRDNDILTRAADEAAVLQHLDYSELEEARGIALNDVRTSLQKVLAAPPYKIDVDNASIDVPLIAQWPSEKSSLSDIRSFIDDHSALAILIWDEFYDPKYEFGGVSVTGKSRPAHCLNGFPPSIEECEPISPGGILSDVTAIDLANKGLPLPSVLNLPKNFPPNKNWILQIDVIGPDDQVRTFASRPLRRPLQLYVLQDFKQQWFADTVNKEKKLRPENTHNPLYRLGQRWWWPYQMWLWRLRMQLKTPGGDSLPFDPDLTAFAIFLPNLASVWRLVERRTPEEAATYLFEKAQARQAVPVLGQPVDERAVAVVAPLAILGVSLYLASYLNILRAALHRIDEPARKVLLYPWVGLYRDRFSRFVTSLTIVFLPSASALLHCVFVPRQAGVVFVLGLLAFGAILWSGIYSWLILRAVMALPGAAAKSVPVLLTRKTKKSSIWK